jgi:endoglucanase
MIIETMNTQTSKLRFPITALLSSLALLFFAGCQCCQEQPEYKSAAAVVPAAPPKPALPTIRIKTGVSTQLTDSSGNVWLPDQGFADGDTIERPELTIENTKDPGIYRAERYSMTAFTQKLPNGKYTVKLHFAETFEGITGPGQRVFSFKVEGREFKNFDVWAKSGGFARAYVETVPVEIMDEKLDIAFIPNIENPEINGIEILPGS